MRPFYQSISRKTLEIEEDRIRIVGPDGQEVREWKVTKADTIVTSQNYHLPNDEFQSKFSKWRMTPHHNFLEIQQGDQKTRLEFHLESYYMLNQVKKAVDNWVAKGLAVKRI